MVRRTIGLAAALLSFSGSAGAAPEAQVAAETAPCWKNGTTADIANCFAASGKQSDDELNRLYARIVRVLTAGDRTKLQKAERLWVAYRDAACTAERDLWDGGTGGNPAYLACVDGETRHHLRYLQATYRLRLQRSGG